MAMLLARLQLSDKEKQLVFTHFGHSENINKHKYQAVGTLQLQTTGKRLSEIHNGKKKQTQSPTHVTETDFVVEPTSEKLKLEGEQTRNSQLDQGTSKGKRSGKVIYVCLFVFFLLIKKSQIVMTLFKLLAYSPKENLVM